MAAGSVYGAVFGALVAFLLFAVIAYLVATRRYDHGQDVDVECCAAAATTTNDTGKDDKRCGRSKPCSNLHPPSGLLLNPSREPSAGLSAPPGNGDWSSAQFYREYLARVGRTTDDPHYVVFNTAKQEFDWVPAPAADAPYIKIHPDGKTELVKPPPPPPAGGVKKSVIVGGGVEAGGSLNSLKKEQSAIVEGTIELSRFFELINRANDGPPLASSSAGCGMCRCGCAACHAYPAAGMPGHPYYYWHPQAQVPPAISQPAQTSQPQQEKQQQEKQQQEKQQEKQKGGGSGGGGGGKAA